MTRTLQFTFSNLVLTLGMFVSPPQEGRSVDKAPSLSQRKLNQNERQHAALIEARMDAAEQAEQYEDAIKHALHLLKLLKEHGKDNWEVVEVKWSLKRLKKLNTLPIQESRRWQQVLRNVERESDLFDEGEYEASEQLLRDALQTTLDIFGKEHRSTAIAYANLASCLNRQGRTTEAQELFDTASPLFLELLGEKHPETIKLYNESASNLSDQGKYQEAAELSRKSVDLAVEVLGESHVETAMSYNMLAQCFNDEGNPVDAEPLLRKAVGICIAALGENHPFTATLYNNLSSTLRNLDKNDEALEIAEKMLELHIKLYGPRHPETGSCYRNLAAIYHSEGMYDKAEPLFQRDLDIQTEHHGEKHPNLVDCHDRLASTLLAQNKHAKAQQHIQSALDLSIDILGLEHPRTATCYNELAAILNAQGLYTEAQLAYQKAFDLITTFHSEDRDRVALAYNNLGFNLNAQGRYAEAHPYYLKALDIRQQLWGKTHIDIAIGYNNVGYNIKVQGEYATAEPYFQKALDLFIELLGEDHPYTAMGYNNLADIFADQERWEEARPLYEKSLKSLISHHGENHSMTAGAYNNVAGVLDYLGEYDKARKYYYKALTIYRNINGERHPDTALAYYNLGAFLESEGEFAEALPPYNKALDIQLEILGKQHPKTILYFNSLASCLAAQGKYANAKKFLLEAASAYEATRLNVASEGRGRAIFGIRHSPYTHLAVIQAQLNSPADAWEAIEKDLARSLSDELTSRAQITLTSEQLLERERLFEALRQLESSLLELSPNATHTASNRSSLLSERAGLEKQLAALATTLSQRELASLSSIQATIPPDAALIVWVDLSSYGPGYEEHWGCVIRNSGEPKWERLIGTGRIEDRTDQSHKNDWDEEDWTEEDADLPFDLREALGSVTSTQSEIDMLAESLYEQRFSPLVQHLDGVKRLYVVAVNEMAGVPVEVLTPNYTVSYIPSGSFLARLARTKRPTGASLFALGDPVFSRVKDQTRSTGPEDEPILKRSEWAELPGTRIELERIGQLFGQDATMLFDSDANEQRLDRLSQSGELSKYRYLHFATHGQTNDESSFDSSLILSQDLSPDDVQQPSQPEYNGSLSAKEVLEYWNLNADLVTLSACESGLGRGGGGDGLLGFAQAFLTAGSRAVCLSLWKVDDSATTLLMTRFYENLLGKQHGLERPMPKAAALAEAKQWLRNLTADEAKDLTAAATQGMTSRRGKGEKLKLIVPIKNRSKKPGLSDRPYDHPRYWAAFVLIGDPN